MHDSTTTWCPEILWDTAVPGCLQCGRRRSWDPSSPSTVITAITSRLIWSHSSDTAPAECLEGSTSTKGFAPNVQDNNEALNVLMEAWEKAVSCCLLRDVSLRNYNGNTLSFLIFFKWFWKVLTDRCWFYPGHHKVGSRRKGEDRNRRGRLWILEVEIGVSETCKFLHKYEEHPYNAHNAWRFYIR